jgi:uncharacterized UPF0146 family protein
MSTTIPNDYAAASHKHLGVQDSTADALAERLRPYGRAVEVGVGGNPAVARRLAERGLAVTATDVHHRDVPDGVRFVRDDVTDPDLPVYRGADVVYALNLPPELHRPVRTVARRVDADCLFTTLGGDPPAVAVTPEQVSGDTVYHVD